MGRVALVQSVLDVLSTYVTWTTLLPKGVSNHIEKLMRNFIWGSTDSKRRWHSISSENVCRPKYKGVEPSEYTDLQ